MTSTNAELRNRVAEDLRLKGTDQDLADEDANKLDARITGTIAHYREKGLFWWANDAVPDQCLDGLSLIMCAMHCGAFGKGGQGFEAGLQVGLAMIAGVKPSAEIETARTLYY